MIERERYLHLYIILYIHIYIQREKDYYIYIILYMCVCVQRERRETMREVERDSNGYYRKRQLGQRQCRVLHLYVLIRAGLQYGILRCSTGSAAHAPVLAVLSEHFKFSIVGFLQIYGRTQSCQIRRTRSMSPRNSLNCL